MVVQRVFKAFWCSAKGKERYMQPHAGNTTGICVSVAHRTTSLRDATRTWKQATRSVS
ncbi:hypothetical protein [Nostoc sp.]|uniref:hypothetical protein n=1 Tax=Nostoc sp. TaxID=1180 RepID=UPI002FF4EB05